MKDKLLWAALVLVALVAIFVSFRFDAPIETWMHTHETPRVLTFMQWVSWVGNWPGHIIVALVGMGVAYFARSKDWMWICLALIVACALGGTVARVGKVSLGRARPTTQAMKAWSGFNVHSKNHSFPSGHTTTTFAFFGTLLFARRKFGAALLPIPALIGASRVFVFAHYFSDVVAGVAFGLLCGYFVARWFSRYDSEWQAKSKTSAHAT